MHQPGTSSIVDAKSHEPLLSTLALIVETAVKLRKDGHRVVIVSSGAIGVGLQRMDVERRPKNLSKLQVNAQLLSRAAHSVLAVLRLTVSSRLWQL